jgi:glycogen operon protein
VDWRLRSRNLNLLRFVRLLAHLRRRHVEFRRETFLKGVASRASVKDVTWLSARGTEMTQGEWHDASLRTLGIWFGKGNSPQGRLLLLLNGGSSPQLFQLPAAPAEEPWICQFDTAVDVFEARSLGMVREYLLEPHSTAFLEC